MSLTTQIVIYASTIAAMLTFMRLIAGITGSQMVRMSILRTAFISTLFIVGAGFAKILMNFSWFSNLINQHLEISKNLSTIFFIFWAILAAYHFGLGVVVRLYARTLRFKDFGTIKNLRAIPLAKVIRDFMRRRKDDNREYETNPANRGEHKKANEIWAEFTNNKRSRNQPIVLTHEDPWELRKKTIKYIVDLSEHTNEDINYVCCNISPDNIWNLIKEQTKEDQLNKLKNRLVFVDAYTTTFGFEDEILRKRANSLKNNEHVSIVSCDSSAGIHSGTAKAFKILKEKTKSEKGTRRPCTVIYDSLSVMSIPETDEEVSEFIIHLTAAELTYDMHTIFLEADFDDRDNGTLDTMKACCGKPISC